MSRGQPSRRSPLHDVHVTAGARMVDFAGWEMPIQYTSVIQEHLAVRARVGLFDVTHMGEAVVRGPGALELLQWVTCNDVSRLSPGRAQYNAMTLPNGAFVDDLIVYHVASEEYLLVLNASNTGKDVAWLSKHAEGRRVEVEDVSERWALLALQGPRAAEVCGALTDGGPTSLRSFGLMQATVADASCIISRTGYTGEDGFELFVPAGDVVAAWHALLGAGASFGLVPAGLAARDTLRLEARLALYGNDIDETTTVLEAGLGWIVKLDKGPFIGRDVLERQKQDGVSRRLTGFELQGRSIARRGHSILHEGQEQGRVTSGNYAPSLGKSIGLAYLPGGLWAPGTQIEVQIRGRKEPAEVVKTPFYKRPK